MTTMTTTTQAIYFKLLIYILNVDAMAPRLSIYSLKSLLHIISPMINSKEIPG